MLHLFAGPVFGLEDVVFIGLVLCYLWAPYFLLPIALILMFFAFTRKKLRNKLSGALLIVTATGLLGIFLTFITQEIFEPLLALCWVGILAVAAWLFADHPKPRPR